jgi:O-antigen/teichoic acid export membrane protein
VLGFVTTLLIARNFTDADFGIFSAALVVMQTAAILSSLALDNGLVRYLSLYLETDRPRAARLLAVAIRIRLVSGLAVLVGGYFLSPLLAVGLFGDKPELITPLRLAFAGAFFLSLRELAVSVLQAHRHFFALSVVELVGPTGKVLAIIALLFAAALRPIPVLVIYAALPLLSVIIGSLLLPRHPTEAGGDRRDVFFELFHFSKWVAVSYISGVIFERLDILMLTRYMSEMGEVGIYSLGYRFVAPLLLVSSSLMLICTPMASRMTSVAEYRNYISSILKITVPVGLLFCLLFPFSGQLIGFLFRRSPMEAAAAGRVFNILLVGVVIQVMAAPLTLIAYAESKPQVLACADLIRLAVNAVGNYLLIKGALVFPAWGIYGAAVATSLTMLAGNAFVLGYIYRRVLKKKSFPVEAG